MGYKSIIFTLVLTFMICGCDIVDFFPEDGGKSDKQKTEITKLSGKVGASGKDATLRHKSLSAALPAGTEFDFSFDGENKELLTAARKLPFAVYVGCGLLIVAGVGVGFLSRSTFGIYLGGGIALSGILVFSVFYAFNLYPWVSLVLIFMVVVGIVSAFLYAHDPKRDATV